MERRLIALAAALLFVSCSGGYKTSEEGVKYKFHETHEKERMPKDDEMALCYYTISYGDTTLYSTYEYPDPARVVILERTYEGDLFDALKMMHEGDSATFKFNADSFYNSTFGMQRPSIIPEGKEIVLSMKLFKVVSEDEYVEYLKVEEKEHVAIEKKKVEGYIKDNYLMMEYDSFIGVWNYTENPDTVLISPLDYVTFHCLAKTLEGETIINTYISNKPISVSVATGELKPPVLDEILQFLSEGGSGKFIVPYLKCFGPKGDGNRIPPYSTFVFDIFIEKVEK
jgi:FKBP-type peptidyl-prolyl cis-trans isomerase FkpA